ncbi:MAG: STAS domain-containing protein [Planctomycetota bacterium]
MSTASTACRFEEVDRGVLVVAPRPELNEVQWADIEQIGDGIVDRVGRRNRPRVVIDLSDLNFMGSAMVALVVRVWRTIEERGGRMAVYNESPMVLEVLELAGLTRKWNMVDSAEEGVREVAAGGGAGGGLVPAAIAWVGLAAAGVGLYGVLTPGTLPQAAAVLCLCVGGLVSIAAAAFGFVGGVSIGSILAAVAGVGGAGVLIGGVLAISDPKPAAPPAAGSVEAEDDSPDGLSETEEPDGAGRDAETSAEE